MDFAQGTPPASLAIDAEIRYSDALLAGAAQFVRRARPGLAVYGLLLAASAAGWLAGSAVSGWVALALAAAGAALPGAMAWLVRRDFRARGGKPLRLRYHVCGSGIEVQAPGRSDWLAWDDLWDVGETRRSFLVSPAPGEQYVIPKRCCGESVAGRLRETLRALGPASGRD